MLDVLTLDSAPDALTNHSTQNPDNNSDALTPDSAPDALTEHSAPVVVGLDWERDGWRVSEAGKPSCSLPKDALLRAKFLDADYVVVEQAHMRERDVYSVAQVYTRDELQQLPFKDKLRLFPGMPGQLAKAARDVGNVTGETNEYGGLLPDKAKDAETMAQYAAKHPQRLRSWKKFRLPDEDKSRDLWPARDALRSDVGTAMNQLRVAWNNMRTAERYALPEVADFCALLDRNFDRIPDGVKEQYGITRGKKKPHAIRVERMSAALTVYLLTHTRDGRLRTHNGKPLGMRFMLKTVGLCNSYKPNMVRSQLTHHGMRHYKGGRDGGYRSEYMRNFRHFIRLLQSDALTNDSAPDALTLHSAPQ